MKSGISMWPVMLLLGPTMVKAGSIDPNGYCSIYSYIHLADWAFLSTMSTTATVEANRAAIVTFFKNLGDEASCFTAVAEATTADASRECSSVCDGSGHPLSVECLWCNFLSGFRVTSSLGLVQAAYAHCSLAEVAVFAAMSPVPIAGSACDATAGCLILNVDPSGIGNRCQSGVAPYKWNCGEFCSNTGDDATKEAVCAQCFQFSGALSAAAVQTRGPNPIGLFRSVSDLIAFSSYGWTACLEGVVGTGSNNYADCFQSIIANPSGDRFDMFWGRSLRDMRQLNYICTACGTDWSSPSCALCVFGHGMGLAVEPGVVGGSTGSCASSSDLAELGHMPSEFLTWCTMANYGDAQFCLTRATGKASEMCAACVVDQFAALSAHCDTTYCSLTPSSQNIQDACKLCNQAAGFQAAMACQTLTYTTTSTTTTTTSMTTTTEEPTTSTMTATTTRMTSSTPIAPGSGSYFEQFGDITIGAVTNGEINEHLIAAAQSIIASLPADLGTSFSSIAASNTSSDLVDSDIKNLQLLVGVVAVSRNSTIGQLVSEIITGESLTTHQTNLGAMIDAASVLSSEAVSAIVNLVSGNVSSSDTLSRVSDVLVGAPKIGHAAASSLLQLVTGNYTEGSTSLDNMQAILGVVDLSTIEAISAFTVIAGNDTNNTALASLYSVVSSVPMGAEAVASVASALSSGTNLSTDALLEALSGVPITYHIPTNILANVMISILSRFDIHSDETAKEHAVAPLSWILMATE